VLPGDSLIADVSGSFTHAVTIHRPRREVWPWLAQMGAGSRAGWYSYDLLDNRGHNSADRIVPELQHIEDGMLFPALPGETEGFHVLKFQPEQHLVLGWTPPERTTPFVTWAFVLDAIAEQTTRLIVRARGARDYRFHGLLPWLGTPVIAIVHHLMERKQLQNIAARAEASSSDPLLDRFMTEFDVVERHHIHVAAPAEIAMQTAVETNLEQSPVVRAIIRTRAWLLGATPTTEPAKEPKGLLTTMHEIGWGKLAEVPGREIVMGAVTRPWEADVVFRAIPADAFAAFREPGYVKIVWTLRADPIGAESCDFVTETRVLTTDASSRAKFSPGIIFIRHVLLRQIRRDAERRAVLQHA